MRVLLLRVCTRVGPARLCAQAFVCVCVDAGKWNPWRSFGHATVFWVYGGPWLYS